MTLWKDYDVERRSKNDHPKEFTREHVSSHIMKTKYHVIMVEHGKQTMPINLPLT
jgi:hypothetical protein